MVARGRALLERLARRRSVREFSPDPVPRELIEMAIAAANTAPSGANRQPWHFVASPTRRSRPRSASRPRRRSASSTRAAGRRRRGSRRSRRSEPVGGNRFSRPLRGWWRSSNRSSRGPRTAPRARTTTSTRASASPAVCSSRPSTRWVSRPSPTLRSRCGFSPRSSAGPDNERPFILFPVGYPHPDCQVPSISKKDLVAVSSWFEDAVTLQGPSSSTTPHPRFV